MAKAPSPNKPQTQSPGGIDLRDRWLAAFLAWLLPGLGHFYQRRTAKGVLFCVMILSTFCYGLVLGEGRVVYASFGPQERRLPYLSQVGVGLPALPALVQMQRVRAGKEPLFGESRFMAPPNYEQGELSALHLRLNRRWELGSVFTMIAGLLNFLVIYDAFAGPADALRGAPQQKATERPPPGSAGST
ncbi:MAG: hypothetical protein K2Y37_03215 [Pirellulales bacterium]|nr:hypothetical protein [Pirellulales bacterium]